MHNIFNLLFQKNQYLSVSNTTEAQNIANMNVPGYQAIGIESFKDYWQRTTVLSEKQWMPQTIMPRTFILSDHTNMSHNSVHLYQSLHRFSQNQYNQNGVVNILQSLGQTLRRALLK